MDLDQFFTRVQEQYEKNLPFALYRNPKNPLEVKVLLQNTDRLFRVEDFSECGFVFAGFQSEGATFLIPKNVSEEIISVFPTESRSEEKKLENSSRTYNNPGEQQHKSHLERVERAIVALKAGKMEKVVLSRQEMVSLKGSDPILLFQELWKTYPQAFVYCWFHPKKGLWLGATPETLLKITKNHFESMALAGTQAYHGTMEVNWGEKEKQEQQYVTDSILDHVREVGITELNTSEVQTVKAGNVLHLRTQITGKLLRFEDMNSRQSQLKKLILAVHPTPAVCGLPKNTAREYILAEEDYPREFYTGFLGELNYEEPSLAPKNREKEKKSDAAGSHKQSSLFVNLRCMKITDNQAILYVGGGITKDSIPEDEWLETCNKAETMKKVLLK